MSKVVAIDLSASVLVIVKAETSRRGGLTVTACEHFAYDEDPARLRDFLGEEIDGVVAIGSSRRVLFHHLTAPFSDKRRLEQIIPFQLQDLVPFDTEAFVVDSIILGKSADGEFDILAALMPREDVAEDLKHVAALGIEPAVLTSRAGALSGYRALAPCLLQGTTLLLGVSGGILSIAALADGAVMHLREVPLHEESRDLADAGRALVEEVRATTAKVEGRLSRKVERISIVGSRFETTSLSQALGLPVEQAVPAEVEYAPGLAAKSGELVVALGALAALSRTRMVDFRQGEFSYKPAFGLITAALKEEGLYLALGVIFALAWFFSALYSTQHSLTAVEQAMADRVRQVIANAAVPPGKEVEFVEGKVREMEERHRGMGTLSALSPLESLKELSETIGPQIDLAVESMNIGHSRISIVGSVLDFPTVGKLSGAFEKRSDRFCDVKVDPKGQAAGSNRVRISADLKLCE